MTPPDPISIKDIQEAATRLRGVAHRTPAMTSRQINDRTGAEVYFKCENLQRTGSFKFRGAYNALLQLAKQNPPGVLTFSSGNHAQGLALAGQILGIKPTIVMPDDAPPVKIEATRGYGAEIILYDKNEITREELGRQISEERGLPVIPPYDHPHVMAGQGTAALELFQDIDALDCLYVCVGGGGLISGCALAAKSLHPDCRVIGVEPETADDATRSFRTGELQTVHNPPTIADGARTPYLGKHTFPMVLKYVDDMMTVSDEELLNAMFLIWERMKIVVEPTGALAAAGMLKANQDRGRRVGVIISGGNVDMDALAELRRR